MREFIRDLLSDLLPVLMPILAAAVAEMLRRLLRVQSDSEAGKAINLAVERAAARAYQNAVAAGVPLTNTGAISQLLGQATNDAALRVNGAMARRGVSHGEMFSMVQGEFARAIVADPTIPGPKPATKE
jgi:hypothetical protein